MTSDFDAKEYYNKHIKGKTAYCGPKEESNKFVIGEFGFHCEIVNDKDVYMTSYMWSTVFDLLLDGTWKIDGFRMTDEYRKIKIDEIENKLNGLKSDIEFNEQYLAKLKT